MKWFGGKAGREGARPVLSRGGTTSFGASGDAWLHGGVPGYEAQVREGYCRNAIAQRAVKLVAEAIGNAPLAASDPALVALVTARSGGQPLIETVAAQLLLHGIPERGSIASAWSRTRSRRGGWAGEAPTGYAMRGKSAAAMVALLDARLARADGERPGDVLLVVPGPAQFHLAVRTTAGIVHADAALRRVVERPGPLPWPLIGAWRMEEK